MSSCPPHTIADLLDVYERDYLPCKAPATAYNQRLLYRHYRAAFGALHVTEITPAWLRAWQRQLATRLKPGTVRVYMDALSAALTYAVTDLEWLHEQPMRKVRKLPDPPTHMRFLSPEERQRLLRACRRSDDPRLYPVVLLALHTGARKSELLHLRRRDVNLLQKLVVFTTTKTKVARAVPLTGLALELLSHPRYKILPPDAWLFPGPETGRPTRIDYAWTKARQEAGLTDFRFHDLRHTAASYLLMSGANLVELADILGHRTMGMVKRYAHFTQGHTRGVLTRMAQQFLGGLVLAGGML